MHYPWNAFAIDRKMWTIQPKEAYVDQKKKIGQRERLSDLDVAKVNAAYRCTKKGGEPISGNV